MNITPSPYRFVPKKTYLFLCILLTLVGVSAVGFYRYSRPISPPIVEEQFRTVNTSEEQIAIDWPPSAQASIGTTRDGVLASKPGQTAKPTASTAKLITVLTVLKEKPLALDEQGPTLTMDQQDISLYNTYYAAGGSLVAVQLGEQLSQYQMLQGILIRSGNNLADSLALWAFGSLSEYQKAAQALVDELGMTNTTIGIDASGLSPTTISTAEDLTRLGIAAMKHEVVREIVRQTSSQLPVDGVRPNTNWMLGQNGVVGIKTGNIPEVGGVFVIASEYTPEGEEPITIVGAVQGEPTTAAAITTASRLTEAAKSLFVEKTVVKAGDTIATITTPWGESSTIIAKENLTTFGWKYKATNHPRLVLNSQPPFEANSPVGSVILNGQLTDAIATSTIRQPSWQWRLLTNR